MALAIMILILAVVLVVGALIAANIYNRLISLQNRVLNAFAQIDVQLKRRHDLIPNLVEAVKGYMAHERQTLQQVVEARNTAAAARSSVDPRSPSTIATLAGAEQQLVAALGQLMAIKEAYPNLKADQNAARLMEELSSTENRVAFARQNYNDSVMLYNTARQTFPSVVFAGLFRFPPAVLFQIDDAAQREVVKVAL